MKHILVPVDYSDSSRAALVLAADLAAKYAATLDVVHVWDRPAYVANLVMTTSEPVGGKTLVEMIQLNAQRDLDEFLKSVALPAEVRQSSRLLSGDPAAALLEEIKSGKYDLVVVGTHGRTGLSHVLLGSVAEKLGRLSPVPVLTVPDAVARGRRL